MKGRVLITGARAPAAVELAILFSRIGAEIHVADSTPLLLAAGLKSVAAGHRLPGARQDPRAYAAAVAALVARLGVDLVVPTCEEVFFLAAGRDAGHAIPVLAPSLSTLRRLHDKFAFVELARAAGVQTPPSVLISSPGDLNGVRQTSRDLVFKPCFSRFGTETLIGPAPDLLSAIPATPSSPWIAQQLLRGDELCAYALATEGRLAAFSAYRPRYRMGKAASYYFEPVDLPQGEEIAAKIIGATGFHGQIAFDLIHCEDGRLLPIECNPRATSGVHLFAGRPELVRRMLGGSDPGDVLRPCADTRPAMVGAAMWLFGAPRALRRGGLGAWRHDHARARDVLAGDGSSLNLRAWRVFGSYCLAALRAGSSLRAIATSDIEWNGEAIDARP